MASFKIMTPKQANNLQPMTSHQLNLITQYPDEATPVLNHILIERRIYDEIVKLRAEEKLDPTSNKEERQEFLANFKWEQSILNLHKKQEIEALLVKYHDTFVRHRLDIGIDTEFKIKLTPKHSRWRMSSQFSCLRSTLEVGPWPSSG